ncbi:hypothetical protein CDV31_004000 [Fusarium ambrosium]|uniref:Uncharacterized protein n=1 Tax=Fusarium ambrosium TaxID=131363 RepID=A0A428US64_9HYPO|nr:hypothetical protein CDV31_004000 [Fusarium ambrosium]
MQHESSFMVLDGGLVLLAAILVTVFHPDLFFLPMCSGNAQATTYLDTDKDEALSSGAIAVDPFNMLRLAGKNVKLMRPMLDGYVSDRVSLEKYTKEVWDLTIAKKLEIIIHDIYSLEETTQAHQDIECRKTTNKLLIKCD